MYDTYGRVKTKTFTNSSNVTHTEKYAYNGYGYLDSIYFDNVSVYDVSTMNVRGQITAATIGIAPYATPATWGYNSYGQLTSSSGYYVQSYSYVPNTTTGNLTSRTRNGQSGQTTLAESFNYDNLDRLTSVTGTNALTLTYDTGGKGNIATKSDAGTLVYDLSGKPYAVRHVNPYDTINFPSASQTITYTSFGKVNTINEGTSNASFKYNADNERVKMVLTNGTNTKTKYYFGGSYEKVIEGGVTTEYIWIGGDPYTAVAVAKISGGTTTVYSIFRDNLGTITHLKTGSSPADEYSFDAFGRRRSADDWSYTLDANDKALFDDRGFTGHEYLGQFGLYNMNGRLYDPLVGRFLSPDNYVQSPVSTQGFNRYSYCLNNPLRYTDPSGESWKWPKWDKIYALPGVGQFIYIMQMINDNTVGLRQKMVEANVPDINIGSSINGEGTVNVNGSINGREVFNLYWAKTNSAGQEGKPSLIAFEPEHTDAFDGFWGKTSYFLFGPNVGNARYDMNGNYLGPALITGMAPTPGFKGGSVFIKGWGMVEKELFHTVVKKDILKAAGNFSKAVGTNPNVAVEEGLIILKGTGPYSGKVFQTGLDALDFFGF